MTFAPRPLTGELKDVTLSGKLLPMVGGQPVFTELDHSDALYISVFTDEAKLNAAMEVIGVTPDKVVIIDDTFEFLDSIPLKNAMGQVMKIIVDIRRTEKGTFRFTEIQR